MEDQERQAIAEPVQTKLRISQAGPNIAIEPMR